MHHKFLTQPELRLIVGSEHRTEGVRFRQEELDSRGDLSFWQAGEVTQVARRTSPLTQPTGVNNFTGLTSPLNKFSGPT
jgi:hypothetical protein